MDEVEAVARAIEDQLTAEDGWMVGTPAIKRMCEDFAQAAIAALDEARGDPVAIRNAALEEAANAAYVACAETRHVSLGDKCTAAIRVLKEHLK